MFNAEITTPKYWIHIGIIAVIVLGILQIWQGGNMLTTKNVLWSIPLLGVADIAAHNILKLN